MSNFHRAILINLHRIIYYVIKARIWLLFNKHSEIEKYALANEMITKMNDSMGTVTISKGQDKLPQEGGYMLYPNHQGKYDVPGIFTTHRKPLAFVIDENRSHMALVAEILKLTGGKAMRLDDPRHAIKIFQQMAEELKEGKKYILFPEGGYKENNENIVEDFKAGSFKVAKMAQVPIVPVALVDSYKVYNDGHRGPATAYVYYLDPIYYEDYKNLSTREIARMVQDRIREKIKEHEETH
ncbi:MAG: 1-acyl-sn-glycerol-3-phosphate acyltransferase [Butyrivibrio sp.]|nr:1-acyl-sn-glycerol-3-phosphate acyltransferase [Butyrivibrio sp.]